MTWSKPDYVELDTYYAHLSNREKRRVNMILRRMQFLSERTIERLSECRSLELQLDEKEFFSLMWALSYIAKTNRDELRDQLIHEQGLNRSLLLELAYKPRTGEAAAGLEIGAGPQ